MAELKKELSLFTATFYGIGIILGAGIYAIIGEGAGIAGNALWLSFVFAAIIASFTGLSYAELSGMFPKTSAEYVYTKKAFKKSSFSFIVQWIMIFTVIVSATTVSLGFGGYLETITGIDPIIGATALIVVLSIVSYIGMKESARFNIFSTMIEMGGLVIVAVIGMFFIGSAKINYFVSPGGINTIFAATGIIFFAYIGFEELVNLSEDTKNAERVIPKALIISLIVSTILYILVSVSAISILGPEQLAASDAPLTAVINTAFPGGGVIISFIALFATGNTILALLIVASRMLYGLSKNNMFPSFIGRIGKRQTPYVSIFIVMVVALGALMIGNIKAVASITNVGVFIIFVVMNAALIKLRYSEPNMKRTFKSPINIGRFPVLALFGLISAIFMLYYLARIDFLYFVYEFIVILIGLGVYLVFTKFRKLHEREKYAPLFRKSIYTSRKKHLIRTLVSYSTVSQLMKKKVITVEKTEPVKKAVELMNKHRIGCVVITEDHTVAGIITERDILKRVVGKKKLDIKCEKVMSKPIISISPEDPIAYAIELMTRNKIKKLIVSKNRILIGILTATDIVRGGHRVRSSDIKKLSKIIPVNTGL